MSARTRIPKEIEREVLINCRRRCAVCFGLAKGIDEKKGQIAHLDGDPSNNNLDNLVFLCLDHHDQYDTRTSQSKNLTQAEVARYRDQLLHWVAANFPTVTPGKSSPIPKDAPPLARKARPTPQAATLSGRIVATIAAEWHYSDAEVRAEIQAATRLLERLKAADLATSQLRLLEIVADEDKGSGLPRRVVETAGHFPYMSTEFYDEITVLKFQGFVNFDFEYDDAISLRDYNTWQILKRMCGLTETSIGALMQNPSIALIMEVG